MDIGPGQAAPTIPTGLTGQPLYGMFRRTDKGTVHLLPLNGNYEAKRREDGTPLFVYLPDVAAARDDVFHDNPHDVQHADRIKRKRK